MIRLFTVVISVMCLVSTSPILAGTWRDDFEDGNLDPWQRENPPMGGEIWNDEDGICSGQYTPVAPETHSALFLKVDNTARWKDYTVTFKAKVVETFGEAGGGSCTFGLDFRYPPGLNHASCQALILPESKRAVSYVNLRVVSDVPLPFDILKDTWYELKLIAEGDHFEFYINGEPIGSFDDGTYPSGGIYLRVSNTHVHFDDVVITGPEIPDGGPGFAVIPFLS